jgi:hypothetical protein
LQRTFEGIDSGSEIAIISTNGERFLKRKNWFAFQTGIFIVVGKRPQTLLLLFFYLIAGDPK